jgi:hypothetical protein
LDFKPLSNLAKSERTPPRKARAASAGVLQRRTAGPIADLQRGLALWWEQKKRVTIWLREAPPIEEDWMEDVRSGFFAPTFDGFAPGW